MANTKRFIQTLLLTYKGKYFTGDGCRATRTATIGSPAVSTSAERLRPRLGTAEVESALVSHNLAFEAAVVGYRIRSRVRASTATFRADGRRGRRRRTAPGASSSRAFGDRADRDAGTRFSSRPACRKHARARSCARILRRSPRTISVRSATRRRSPIQVSVDDLIANRQNRALM